MLYIVIVILINLCLFIYILYRMCVILYKLVMYLLINEIVIES
jgi:hypothetical protein